MKSKFVVANVGPDQRKGVPEIWATLPDYGELEYREMTHFKNDREAFFRELEDVDVLVCGLEKIDAEIMERGKNLKAVMKRGVGYDNFDVEAATKHGIHVVIGVGNHFSVAEATITLMLAAARNLPYWNKNTVRENKTLGIEMVGKTLGLVGYGRVGSHVAQIATGLGMNITIYDPYIPEAARANIPYKFIELEQLLRESDVISLHCPLTPGTREMISMEQLKMMKSSAILVNTARGGLMNEADVAQAVEEGIIFAAGVDVLTDENDVSSSPLQKVDRVIVTPHKLMHTAEVLQRTIGNLRDSCVQIYNGTVPVTSMNRNQIDPALDRILNSKK